MSLRDATVPAADGDDVPTFEIDGSKMAALYESLTGRESLDMKRALGRPFQMVIEDTDEESIFGLLWILKRRDDPTLTFDAMLDSSTTMDLVREFGDLVNQLPGPDPTNAASGMRSRRSATTGE